MSDAELVDAFVATINSGPRNREMLDEVPEFLRKPTPEPDEWLRDNPITTDWHIVRRDNSRRIDDLQRRAGRTFPPSFRHLLGNYCFPAFESDPERDPHASFASARSIMFFANTGEHTFWELEDRLFSNPQMSPYLLREGFLQIGNPLFYHYDPVCFDCNSPGEEKRLVLLDHEAILCESETRIVAEIAPSFPEWLRMAAR